MSEDLSAKYYQKKKHTHTHNEERLQKRAQDWERCQDLSEEEKDKKPDCSCKQFKNLL